MKTFIALACLCLIGLSAVPACQQNKDTRPKEFPKESYEYPPEKPDTPDDYAIKFNQMRSFYDVPGEFGHIMIGKDHGFKSLSFIVTETHPGGGPPLHTHETEEAHVLLEGRATYWSLILAILSKSNRSSCSTS